MPFKERNPYKQGEERKSDEKTMRKFEFSIRKVYKHSHRKKKSGKPFCNIRPLPLFQSDLPASQLLCRKGLDDCQRRWRIRLMRSESTHPDQHRAGFRSAQHLLHLSTIFPLPQVSIYICVCTVFVCLYLLFFSSRFSAKLSLSSLLRLKWSLCS